MKRVRRQRPFYRGRLLVVIGCFVFGFVGILEAVAKIERSPLAGVEIERS